MRTKINKSFVELFPPWMSSERRFALVKYGGGIVQASGSIAGNVFARNRFGNYMRARTKPVNPRSDRQVGARDAIAFLAAEWRSANMDDAKRTAWATFANSVDWQNKLGETVKLTGFNMFMRANAAILMVDGAIVYTGPEELGLPAKDPVFKVTNISAAAQTYTVTWDDTLDWCDENTGFMLMYQGLPQNPTRNFFNGPWRYNDLIVGNVGAPPTSPNANEDIKGWTAIEGQKIWFQGAIVRADGRMSRHFTSDPTIVVA